jgi:hypothetical protein
MKRFLGMAVLALGTSVAQADDFGLQLKPGWNERGELSITLTNYSKSSIEAKGLVAEIGEPGNRACRWRELGTFKLAPVEAKVVAMASTRSVRRCLDRLPSMSGSETRSLRFGMAERNAAQAVSEPVRIRAEVQRAGARGQAIESLTLVRTGGAP